VLVISCFFGSKKNYMDSGGKERLFGPGSELNIVCLSSEGAWQRVGATRVVVSLERQRFVKS